MRRLVSLAWSKNAARHETRTEAQSFIYEQHGGRWQAVQAYAEVLRLKPDLEEARVRLEKLVGSASAMLDEVPEKRKPASVEKSGKAR